MVLKTGCGPIPYRRKRSGRMMKREIKIIEIIGPTGTKTERKRKIKIN
jgi:hypothetical protein